MITEIILKNKASFGKEEQSLGNLKKINFIYGANGSGKTTISRVIANEESYDHCGIVWNKGSKIKTVVYNKDFIDENFHKDDDIKGVFTLGEADPKTLENIKKSSDEAKKIEINITRNKVLLNGGEKITGKLETLKDCEEKIKDICWKQKQKYDDFFKDAFVGVRRDGQKFKEKFLLEIKNNKSELLAIEELKEKAKTIFVENLEREQLILPLSYVNLIELENSDILKKKVIGKDDVDIAAMIKKLDNSDWVKEGRKHYDNNDGICPFCQQSTNEDFARSLNDYFDEAYLEGMKSIDDMAFQYKQYSDTIISDLQIILDNPSKHLNVELFSEKKKLLASNIATNKKLISEKKEKPSSDIIFIFSFPIIAGINTILDEANSKIKEHNDIVKNIKEKKQKLISEVWKFVTADIKVIYDEYKEKRDNIIKAVDGLQSKIQEQEKLKLEKESEVRELEGKVTKIQPTIKKINKLLKSFGFTNFSLAKAGEGKYNIVRPDGSNAKETLSEGEKTFITFLYFYHLLKGSTSETGVTDDRVVVFDDPVSSLDSNILFIVSTLINKLFEEVIGNTGYIKQIFVLTHNVYFHKQVTFKSKKGETFWIVSKFNNNSIVKFYPNNPVKTSYELLWQEVKQEVKEAENKFSNTIQNTLRRILENYFKILGGIKLENLPDEFEGEEKQICTSLVSWVHAGSHDGILGDDLSVAFNKELVQKYLQVFKKIFENSGHIEHYNMMMSPQPEPQHEIN